MSHSVAVLVRRIAMLLIAAGSIPAQVRQASSDPLQILHGEDHKARARFAEQLVRMGGPSAAADGAGTRHQPRPARGQLRDVDRETARHPGGGQLAAGAVAAELLVASPGDKSNKLAALRCGSLDESRAPASVRVDFATATATGRIHTSVRDREVEKLSIARAIAQLAPTRKISNAV